MARHSLVMQIHADILDGRIKLAESEFPVALGAAILGCIAAGPAASGHASVSQAIHAMAHQRRDLVYRPDLKSRRTYAALRQRLDSIAAGGAVRHVFKTLG
jgi:ribulose kinase